MAFLPLRRLIIVAQEFIALASLRFATGTSSFDFSAARSRKSIQRLTASILQVWPDNKMCGSVHQVPVINVIHVVQIGLVDQSFLLLVTAFIAINQSQQTKQALLMVGRLNERMQCVDLEMAIFLNELSNDRNANAEELVALAVLADARFEKTLCMSGIVDVAAGLESSMHLC